MGSTFLCNVCIVLYHQNTLMCNVFVQVEIEYSVYFLEIIALIIELTTFRQINFIIFRFLVDDYLLIVDFLADEPVESCLYDMNSFPLPHAAFSGVGHPSYTDVAMTNPPPQYPHSPHVAMGLLDPGGGNFLPHYPHQRLSPLPQVEAAYDREER